MSKNAFTLIELLVVVLIIGILAAVALPQYQRAVERARAVEAFTNLKALVTAEKVYKMANGSATEDLPMLDIQLTGNYNADTKKFTSDHFIYHIISKDTGEGFEIIAERLSGGDSKITYYIYYANNAKFHCVAKTDEANPICQSLSGKSKVNPNERGYYYYIL